MSVDTSKIRSLDFKKNVIDFINFSGLWVVPGKLLGKVLGYANDGEKLTDLIIGSWRQSFEILQSNGTTNLVPTGGIIPDGVMLKGDSLHDFKAVTGQKYLQAPALLVLTTEGVIKVLTRSRAGVVRILRSFLASKGKELFSESQLDELKPSARLPAKKVNSKKITRPTRIISPMTEEKSGTMSDLIHVLDKMKGNGLLTKAEQKGLYSKLVDIQFTKLSKEAGVTHFLNPDGTVSLTKTSAMSKDTLAVPEGNFNIITNETPNHPAYLDWLSAADIGRPFGLKADLVKKYVKAYCLARGEDLPNNDAKKFVSANGDRYPALDDHGYVIFKPKHGFGIALIAKMEGNSLNWRNYWAPEVVKVVRKTIAKERGFYSSEASTDMKQPPASEVTINAEAVKEAPVVNTSPSNELNSKPSGNVAEA